MKKWIVLLSLIWLIYFKSYIRGINDDHVFLEDLEVTANYIIFEYEWDIYHIPYGNIEAIIFRRTL